MKLVNKRGPIMNRGLKIPPEIKRLIDVKPKIDMPIVNSSLLFIYRSINM